MLIAFVVPMGLSSGLGEPTSLSFFARTIGSENISGWGFGTGLAGVIPNLILMLLKVLGTSISLTFIIFSVFSWI